MPGKGRGTGTGSENTKTGTGQDDVLDGTGGSFNLSGGRGNDTYWVDDAGDSVDEKNNGGDSDHVFASIDWILEDNVELLTLTGDQNLSGTGNELDNQITGGLGDNILSGGAGNDSLDGGAGFDSARFIGNRDDYVVVVGDSVTTVTHVLSGETDELLNIERIVFDDQTLDILPSPEPPTAANDSSQTEEDAAIVIDLLGNDSGDGIQLLNVGNGSFGTVTDNGDGTVTYTPNPDANGFDAFSYTIVDTNGVEASATVEVEVVPVNDAPIAEDDMFEVGDTPQLAGTYNVLSNDADSDGDVLFVAGAGSTADDMLSVSDANGHLSFSTDNGGTVEIHSDGSFSYAAPTGFSGSDAFTYLASDADGASSLATVQLDVTSVPDEPAPDAVPYYIDSLLLTDPYRLNYGDPVGTGVTVTYAFAEDIPSYYDTQIDGFQSFTEAQRANTVDALQDISSFAGITFVETAIEDAEMVFGVADLGHFGLAYLPYGSDGTGNTNSDVWLDAGFASTDFDPGGTAYLTLIHEIGHALGLVHPDLPADEETQQYTVMTYSRHPMMGVEEPTSYMMYDIAALQHLYGSNDTETAGDDVYTYDELTESLQTIWDAGGQDTLDMSAAAEGVQLDLNAGSYSSVGSMTSENIGIAFGTDIENAIGSSHNDVIIGNDLDNLIVAGAGDDQLAGGAGADSYVFDGASGSNTITDFDAAEDRIDLTGTGLSVADLTTSVEEGGLAISFGETSILLEGHDSDADLESYLVF